MESMALPHELPLSECGSNGILVAVMPYRMFRFKKLVAGLLIKCPFIAGLA